MVRSGFYCTIVMNTLAFLVNKQTQQVFSRYAGGVDMVIEAVIEDIGLKQRIFADLEASCAPHAILATNTSTIDIELVGAKLKVCYYVLYSVC